MPPPHNFVFDHSKTVFKIPFSFPVRPNLSSQDRKSHRGRFRVKSTANNPLT